MLYQKFKDIKKRNLYFTIEYYKKMHKVIVIQLLNNPKFVKKRAYIYARLLKLKQRIRYLVRVQLKNRCIISNRGKAVTRVFSLSRIKMREFINLGLLPGYKKSVW